MNSNELFTETEAKILTDCVNSLITKVKERKLAEWEEEGLIKSIKQLTKKIAACVLSDKLNFSDKQRIQAEVRKKREYIRKNRTVFPSIPETSSAMSPHEIENECENR